MAEDYPYMVSNNKIQPILEKINQAAIPDKFTHEFLKKLGFNSSNDRAVIPLFKRLGFISDTGTPTSEYAKLKDKTLSAQALGERMRDLYSDLYAVNTDIHKATDDEIKGVMSRVTGKDAKSVARYFVTFKALAALAKFDGTASAINKPVREVKAEVESPGEKSEQPSNVL